MKIHSLIITAALCFAAAACKPAPSERPVPEHRQLELDERVARDTAKANKAITDMTNKAFRRRTPEEEKKRQEEVARGVKALLDEYEKASAKAASQPPTR